MSRVWEEITRISGSKRGRMRFRSRFPGPLPNSPRFYVPAEQRRVCFFKVTICDLKVKERKRGPQVCTVCFYRGRREMDVTPRRQVRQNVFSRKGAKDAKVFSPSSETRPRNWTRYVFSRGVKRISENGPLKGIMVFIPKFTFAFFAPWREHVLSGKGRPRESAFIFLLGKA
jgi:hypothetical protein